MGLLLQPSQALDITGPPKQGNVYGGVVVVRGGAGAEAAALKDPAGVPLTVEEYSAWERSITA